MEVTGTFTIDGFDTATFDAPVQVAFQQALRAYLGDLVPSYSRIGIREGKGSLTGGVVVHYSVTATNGMQAGQLWVSPISIAYR